ncbi:MAG TPA: ankyrin repeat domain-containing protein [Panacibacter sp.]|nr:ankyrin repeat domain-containing protein [Panacibacter sp.]HNP44602.1 ankyrin repeat domain-containing protein [Panacibacter sp.]
MKKIYVFILLLAVLSTKASAQSLSEALNKNDTLTALKLINSGYSIDSVDKFGSSALMSACRYTADTAEALFLLNHGAKADYPKSAKGRTALLIACAYYGGVPLCRTLLSHGADINAVTFTGESALMLAASNAKADVVEYLIKAGANTKLKTSSGRTALDYANQASIDDTIKQMMKCCSVDKEKTIALISQAMNN